MTEGRRGDIGHRPDAPSSSVRSRLELRGITKTFGDFVAVDDVSLSLHEGEVHAILGENGAGKTTLMNAVAGFLTPDAGTVLLDGKPIHIRVPGDALKVGIGMVHQHFRLIEQLTVAENLVLGSAGGRRVIRERDLVKQAEVLAAPFGFSVDPRKPVWQLSVGEKQRVEILRVLGRGARVLILDEPTAVLSPTEADALCATLRRMAREDGATVVFISHKLQEVLAVSDRITVMRHGKLVQTLRRSSCDPELLVRLMVGEQRQSEMLSRIEAHRSESAGEIALAVRDLKARDDLGLTALAGVSFQLRSGEILGVAGVAGNGQKELEEVLVGLRPPESGVVVIGGTAFGARDAHALRARRVGYIPEDRNGVGLIPTETIWRNAIMKAYRSSPIRRGVMLDRAAAKEYALQLARRVRLSTENTAALVQHLSGGNAQKLLVGRELDGNPTVLVAVSPTQGLDVGAVDGVWEQLIAALDRNVAILLISPDLDEVMAMADRVIVLYEGAIVGEFGRDELDRHAIGLLMTGGKPTRAEDGGAPPNG